MSNYHYTPPGGDAQIATLADTDFASAPTDGGLLIFDTGSGTWRPRAMSGDATITDGGVVSVDLSFGELNDTLLTSPASGAIPVWSGSLWIDRAVSGDGSLSSTGQLTVNDDSHNHTQLDNSSGQLVLQAYGDGVEIWDGSGTNPSVRFVTSVGAIVGTISQNNSDFVINNQGNGGVELQDAGTLLFKGGALSNARLYGNGAELARTTVVGNGRGISIDAQNADILTGTVDPSTGVGIAAALSSGYHRRNGTTGEYWIKTGSAATAWTKVV